MGGRGAKARADVFRRDLSSKITWGGASELWFVKVGLPSSQAGVGSPLLELSKGSSGGIWWFSFLMSVESSLVVVWSCFFCWGGGRNLGTGLEGCISVHAFQVIAFWPAQILLELVSSKSILKGGHFKALEQHLAPPKTTLKFGHLRKWHAEHQCPNPVAFQLHMLES